MALISDAVFKHADAAPLGFGEAWMGALAYSIQIYFDFSGYSEMAIGLALLFGIRFPINFFSPYKATSIIEFWRRWHMTMTRFFQEFVYMPMQLAATRRIRSPVTNYLIIVVMMFLVGLWHGAGWTWIAWGVLHGLFLCVNHLWRAARSAAGLAGARSLLVGRLLAWTLTYACVVVAWVLFRADDFATASKFYHAMFFMNGFSLPHDAIGLLGAPVYHFLAMLGVQFVSAGAAAHPLYTEHQALAVFLLTLFVATAPNLLQAVRYHAPGRTPRSFSNSRDSLFDADLAFNRRMWAPTLGWATVSGLAFVSSLLMILDDSTRSVFIYFNF